jgi:hypothetical protein
MLTHTFTYWYFHVFRSNFCEEIYIDDDMTQYMPYTLACFFFTFILFILHFKQRKSDIRSHHSEFA